MKKKGNKAFEVIPGMKSGRCPYCGRAVVLRSADGIYQDNSRNTKLYVCSGYPACDAYVRVHPGTNKPVGSLAKAELRALRAEAHRHFDQLHRTGIMSKNDAYSWLACILQSPMSQAHIGYLGEHYCRVVIEESKKLLQARKPRPNVTPNKVWAMGGAVYATR